MTKKTWHKGRKLVVKRNCEEEVDMDVDGLDRASKLGRHAAEIVDDELKKAGPVDWSRKDQ